MRRTFALIVLLALGRGAVADPTPPLSSGQAADAVLAAVEAKDAAALKTLAAKDDPDPWLVADELLARREPDAAKQFAGAAPRKAVARLPAYLAARAGKPDDDEARRSRAAADEAMIAGNPPGALEALGPADATPPADVVSIHRAVIRGAALTALGRLEESVPPYVAAADAAERLGWLSMCLKALQQAGNSSLYRGDHATTFSVWERGIKVADTLGDRAAAAAMTGGLGEASRELGNYPKALDYGERALKMQRELANKAGEANALGSIGGTLYALADYPKALDCFERERKLSEEADDPRGVALALGGISIVEIALGQYSKALEVLGRVFRMQQELGNRGGAAATLVNAASIDTQLGNFPKALEGLEAALVVMEALEDRANASTVLRAIGAVHSSLGDYPKALEYFEKAMTLKEELKDRAGVADTLVGIAIVNDSLGNYPKALELYGKALSMLDEIGSRAAMAVTLGDIGAVYGSLGNTAKALKYAERALTIEQELKNSAGAAWTLGSIGKIHGAAGSFAKALAYGERAVAAMEKLGDRPGVADTLVDIGVAHHALGNEKRALEALERSLTMATELGAREVGLRARCAIAAVELALGDRAKAVARAREAVEGLSLLASGLSEGQGAGVRERFSEVYGVGARAAAGSKSPADVSFFLESGRAGALLESLKGRDALRGTALPEGLRVAEAEASAREALAVTEYRKALEGKDLARILARRKEMEKAQDAIREVVERIQRDAKSAANLLYPRADPLEATQKRLRPGEALVSYGLYAEEPMAQIVTAADVRIVRLAPLKEIEAAVDGLEASRPDSATDAPLAALKKAVIEPLALGKDVRRVLVSPEGALSYVPFAALFDGVELAYEPSATTYGLLLDDATKRGDGVLALGDPDYETKAGDGAPSTVRGGLHLKRLPGTREEAKSLGTKVLLGAEASEAGLRDALAAHARWRGVHFACHGLVDRERPAFSSLALTPSGADDGFLTALEVFRSKLPADLVVLSACETGKGRIVKGEGIVGLTRAFMFAGAPRVICSLWQVNDEATRALMTRFYALWNPKDGSKPMETAAALRAAQEFVRSQEKWKHPYYWAAWVLWGLGD